MPSFRDLVNLNEQGDLGAMLAERFSGERGHVYPRQDDDFMIGFKYRKETPSVQMIKAAVVEHYTKLGYVVEQDSCTTDMFSALLFFKSKQGGFISVVITTFYPLVIGDEGNHLRATTTVCG